MPEQPRHGGGAPLHSRLAFGAPCGGELGTRRRLLRLATFPAVLVAVIATAAVVYLLVGGRPGAPHGDCPLWAVLASAVLLTGAVVVGAAVVAAGEARSHTARLAGLRRQAARGRVELQALLVKVERGERIRPPEGPAPAEPAEDQLDQLRHEIEAAQHAAESAVFQASSLVSGGGDERVEVFVSLARRLQSFVHRQIEYLEELEEDVEDPELLKGLFHVDHLATRVRRHAENLAVLGGAVPRRQWSRPVDMSEVLRSCIAEVEHYARVKLVPPVEGSVRGHAVADVIHLLAELVENATEFSAPQTQVLLRVQRVTAGIAIEVEDRGLGMTPAEQVRMNALLAGAERMDVAELLEDGRVGLFVVATLARRHDIVVQLQSNIYGGVQAVLVLPSELLGDGPGAGQGAGRAIGALRAAPLDSLSRAPLPRRPSLVPGVMAASPQGAGLAEEADD
ncbi:ATP-binding protein [Streptomyces sp. MP131-18]|uniref:sensor histidine kinase n=1 Tax=Streptomyces sp. MP131-18 TaxID=1857892 RepID=UPI00097C828D|nr:sensor protein BasS/PmrB [Streptomyces sp. MP131-18]